MLSKIDTFGPFQVFYPLSCADKCWPANFAAIMLGKGYSIQYSAEETENTYNLLIEGKTESGEWKPLKQFLDEDVETSFSELVKVNVMATTHYFNMRGKAFITHRSNPMAVIFYTWNVEFQAQGAPHIHGTLWLNLKLLEMTAIVDGTLKYFPEKNPNYKYPMKNIAKHSRISVIILTKVKRVSLISSITSSQSRPMDQQ